MQEERTYKITCDECGYSEVAPQSRLPYEEGKTCPRCYKGKMYWVPPAEEARRREVKMPEEERRISIAWAIPAILLLGVGGGLALTLALAREEEAPPEEGPPPGLANLYGKVTDAVTGEPIPGVLVALNGLEVYTDADGNYAFTDLELGTYTITFEKEGYEAVHVDILLIVEGNNELNVEMVPIAAAPFIFANESVYAIVCPKATAYWVPIFDCKIANPAGQRATHTISLRHKRYSHTYDRWDYEYAAVIETFELTLEPGESYSYHYESPPDQCYPSIFMHYTEYFWMEDELGNKSKEVSVYRP